MTIEKVIKQTKPFNNLVEKTMVNVMYTNNWICDRQYRLLKNHGITLQQYNVLRILKGRSPEPITINGIIERMLDKMSNASRLVDKLVQKGFVDRNYRSDDRRACDVTITVKGLEFEAQVSSSLHKFEESLFNLPVEDMENLNQLLDKLRGDAE